MAETVTAISSGFHNSVDSDRLYSANQMNMPYKRLISEGIYASPDGSESNDFEVYQSATSTVSVRAGGGLLGGKWFDSDDTVNFTVPTNTSAYRRIDSVILRMDNTVTGRAASLVYKTGTPSSQPVHPAINTSEGVSELRLADITVSAAGSTTFTVTQTRGSSDCPWITSLIYQVDTSVLFEQYKTAYSDYYAQIQQDNTDYMNAQKASWEAFFDTLTSELDVSMSVMTDESETTTAAQTTEINIPFANYSSGDVLQIFVNGQKLSESMYTISNNKVLFTTALLAGQNVHFVRFRSFVASDIQSAVGIVQNMESDVNGLLSDTGWVPITLASGVTYDSAYGVPAYRIVSGNRVYIRGVVNVPQDSNSIGAVPAAAFPNKAILMPATYTPLTTLTGFTFANVKITASGIITIERSGTAAIYNIPLSTSYLLG